MKLIIFFALVAFGAARPQELEKKPVAILGEESDSSDDNGSQTVSGSYSYPIPDGSIVAIIREESDPIDGANFRHEFEAENGITQSMVGFADENGSQVMSGSYSFPLPDGTIATFTWVADAAGFRVESPLLPVAPVNPHPIPAHAQEQMDFANAQKAAGLAWDQVAGGWF